MRSVAQPGASRAPSNISTRQPLHFSRSHQHWHAAGYILEMRSCFISGGILDFFKRRVHRRDGRKISVTTAIADEGQRGGQDGRDAVAKCCASSITLTNPAAHSSYVSPP
jgi:hypothetical protein